MTNRVVEETVVANPIDEEDPSVDRRSVIAERLQGSWRANARTDPPIPAMSTRHELRNCPARTPPITRTTDVATTMMRNAGAIVALRAATIAMAAIR
jgi:hypothetical protein